MLPPRQHLQGRLARLRHFLVRLDAALRQAETEPDRLLRGRLAPDSGLATIARTRKAALAHEQSQVATLVQSCDELAAHLDALATDDDPSLPDHAATIDQGLQRANDISQWLDLHDDWL